MATRTGRLSHDQNLNVRVNGTFPGKADFTGQTKARAGGRKPLGDLSNAGKPINQALDGSLKLGKSSDSQASKQLKTKNLTVIMNDEAVNAKGKNLESNRKAASKPSEKSHTDSDDHMLIDIELPAIKLKYESADLELKLEEVPEKLLEVQSLSGQHDDGFPVDCESPKLSYCTLWGDDSAVNFKLIESP
ncbi:hypothetical protein RIF29_23638 [Crotalaria pallida]|uniref:Uncharacterized protein n=1 Tax=Crotalaria pallida TaxID=3830 RepID=A0AAN9F8F9_CROPI